MEHAAQLVVHHAVDAEAARIDADQLRIGVVVVPRMHIGIERRIDRTVRQVLLVVFGRQVGPREFGEEQDIHPLLLGVRDHLSELFGRTQTRVDREVGQTAILTAVGPAGELDGIDAVAFGLVHVFGQVLDLEVNAAFRRVDLQLLPRIDLVEPCGAVRFHEPRLPPCLVDIRALVPSTRIGGHNDRNKVAALSRLEIKHARGLDLRTHQLAFAVSAFRGCGPGLRGIIPVGQGFVNAADIFVELVVHA